jgi:hypothetical protein
MYTDNYITILLYFVVNIALVKLEVIDSSLLIIIVLVLFLNSSAFNKAALNPQASNSKLPF